MPPEVPGVRCDIAGLPGLRMHFAVAGPKKGDPVILLHGFPEFWYSWRYQIPALVDAGYRVVAPDQRGYNLTDKKPPYALETLVEDIAHLQEHFGWKRSHIVGHDWGGVAAWAFAAMHPERTLKLVAINAPHPNAYLDACKRLSLQVFMSWYIYFFQFRVLPEYVLRRNDYALVRRILRNHISEPPDDQAVQHYVDAIAQPGALSAAIDWYRAMPGALVRNRGSLPDPVIAAPTLVCWGERDPVLHTACLRTLDRYVPDLNVKRFPKAGHWAHIDAADGVNAAILGFLDD